MANFTQNLPGKQDIFKKHVWLRFFNTLFWLTKGDKGRSTGQRSPRIAKLLHRHLSYIWYIL